jgi:hypothetical protein
MAMPLPLGLRSGFNRTGLLAARPSNIVRLPLFASIVFLPPALDEVGEAAQKNLSDVR